MLSYKQTVAEIAQILSEQPTEVFDQNSVEALSKHYRNTGVETFINLVYEDIYTLDSDDIALGYHDRDTGQNTRRYDVDWVIGRLNDRDDYQTLFEKMCKITQKSYPFR